MLLQIRTPDLAEPSPTHKTTQAKLCHLKRFLLSLLSNRLGDLGGELVGSLCLEGFLGCGKVAWLCLFTYFFNS